MQDLYHDIYAGEIWQKSGCIQHENAILTFLQDSLTMLGYTADPEQPKRWSRDCKSVITCLVDDIQSCAMDYRQSASHYFDHDTVVITDNWVNYPTVYHVHRLPDSFFGIYSYTPELMEWHPQKRFNLNINRIDQQRLLLFLELYQHTSSLDQTIDQDLVNVNCWSWTGDNESTEGLIRNYTDCYESWRESNPVYHAHYADNFGYTVEQMPLKNHDLSVDQCHLSAWINIVPETYSSRGSVAVSEKLFRALATPAPWMVFAGRNTVTYLESLGFDVMRDVIWHQYDDLLDTGSAQYGDKAVNFVYEAFDAYDRLKSQDLGKLKQRCQAAAARNRELLIQMRSRWPADFAHWWAAVVDQL
jgi:hypothetical protein